MKNNIKEIQEFVFKAAFKHFSDYSEEKIKILLGTQTKVRFLMTMERNKLNLERILKALRNTDKDKFFRKHNFVPEFLTLNLDLELYLVDNYICDLSDLEDEETQRTLAKLLGWEGGDGK